MESKLEKMETEFKYILLAGAIILCLVFFFGITKEYDRVRTLLEETEMKRDSLKSIIVEYEIKYDSLEKVKQKEIIKYISLKNDLNKQEDETDSIVNSVYSLDEQQLDSTIRAYKHIERSKN